MTELPAILSPAPDLASPGAGLLALLVAGHLLGDFAFQTRGMVEGKPRPAALAAHGLEVAAVHLAALVPFLDVPVIGAALGIALLHVATDAVKSAFRRRDAGELALFVLDQVAHAAVLLLAFAVLWRHARPLPLRIPETWLEPWTTGLLAAGAFAFNWTGGAALVSATLATLSPGLEEEEDAGSGVRGSGRLIGMLERTIALVLILLGQWAALVLLVAAKSIARFEELKERRFAEYYLVGTLSSLLVAMAVGLGLSWALFGRVV